MLGTITANWLSLSISRSLFLSISLFVSFFLPKFNETIHFPLDTRASLEK